MAAAAAAAAAATRQQLAQKAMAAAAAMVTAMIPRGDSDGYLLGKVSLMTWAVGEAASQPAVGGRG